MKKQCYLSIYSRLTFTYNLFNVIQSLTCDNDEKKVSCGCVKFIWEDKEKGSSQ